MILMDELQKTVSELTRRNAQLRESNSSFRGDVMVLKKLLERREEAKERLGSAATMVSQHTCASIMRVCVCLSSCYVGYFTSLENFLLLLLDSGFQERTQPRNHTHSPTHRQTDTSNSHTHTHFQLAPKFTQQLPPISTSINNTSTTTTPILPPLTTSQPQLQQPQHQLTCSAPGDVTDGSSILNPFLGITSAAAATAAPPLFVDTLKQHQQQQQLLPNQLVISSVLSLPLPPLSNQFSTITPNLGSFNSRNTDVNTSCMAFLSANNFFQAALAAGMDHL